MLNIVLHEPEIPQNTGNIGRTCVAVGAKLHLIKPLGFEITEKAVRRSGLDYWNELELFCYDNFNHFLEVNNNPQIFMATTKAKHIYSEVEYKQNCFVMFGKESAGIPEEILLKYEKNSLRIPMKHNKRSLNLSISVAVILFEALRQNNFSNLLTEGQLHHYKW